MSRGLFSVDMGMWLRCMYEILLFLAGSLLSKWVAPCLVKGSNSLFQVNGYLILKKYFFKVEPINIFLNK